MGHFACNADCQNDSERLILVHPNKDTNAHACTHAHTGTDAIRDSTLRIKGRVRKTRFLHCRIQSGRVRSAAHGHD
jgi:hypothetical protein